MFPSLLYTAAEFAVPKIGKILDLSRKMDKQMELENAKKAMAQYETNKKAGKAAVVDATVAASKVLYAPGPPQSRKQPKAVKKVDPQTNALADTTASMSQIAYDAEQLGKQEKEAVVESTVAATKLLAKRQKNNGATTNAADFPEAWTGITKDQPTDEVIISLFFDFTFITQS